MTTEPRFSIGSESFGEDHLEFFVNGVSVGHATYDEHGSQGMRDMRELFTDIAFQLGVVVEDNS